MFNQTLSCLQRDPLRCQVLQVALESHSSVQGRRVLDVKMLHVFGEFFVDCRFAFEQDNALVI